MVRAQVKRRTTRQQILAALATMAVPELTPDQEAMARRSLAQHHTHEKDLDREITTRRRLLRTLCRSADANINALARRTPRDETLSAKGRAAASALRRKWGEPK
jgi:hypothetical protein